MIEQQSSRLRRSKLGSGTCPKGVMVDVLGERQVLKVGKQTVRLRLAIRLSFADGHVFCSVPFLRKLLVRRHRMLRRGIAAASPAL